MASETQGIMISSAAQTALGKPRATTAYGSHGTRRNLNNNNNQALQVGNER